MEPHLRDSRVPKDSVGNKTIGGRARRRGYLAGIALLAVAAPGVSLASAGADGNATHTLRLVAHQTQYDFLDIGTGGTSLGDQLVFGEVFSKRGDEIGRSGVVCTVTDFEPAPGTDMTVHCLGTLKLEHGQINLQGLMDLHGADDPGPFTVAITGGTGRYRGARGEAVARQPNPPKNVYIYKLRLQTGDKPRS